MNQDSQSKYEKLPFIILLGSLTAFDPLSIDMYLPAFPEIGSAFRVSASKVELSLSAFFIGLAFGQLIYGPLADIYGRKKPLIIGMILYFFASIGCSLSTNINMFIGFRVLQALGGCSGMVITRAIVSDLFDKNRSAHIYSLLMLVMGVAPILSPLLGGLLSTHYGWRSIFDSLALLSFISIICTMIFLPETHKKRLEYAPRMNFFKLVQQTTLNYWHLLKDKHFMTYSLTGGLMRATMFAYIAGSPFVFITLFNIKAQYYGWIFGTNAIGIIGASQINRILIKKYSLEFIFKKVMIISFILTIILFLAATFFHSLFSILLPLFLLMTSMGFIFPNSAALGLAHQGHRAGMASALLGTLQWSIAFLSSYFVSFLHNETARPMAIVMLVSTFLAISCLKFIGNQSQTS